MEQAKITPGLITVKQQNYPRERKALGKSKFLDSPECKNQLMVHNLGELVVHVCCPTLLSKRNIHRGMQVCNGNHIFARIFQKGEAGFGSYS